MNRSAEQKSVEHGSEYVVYTFGMPEQDRTNPRMWERKASYTVMHAAVRQAEELYSTGQYPKVEIKQKYFDRNKNRNIDCTLRVFDSESTFKLRSAVIAVFAMLCGIAASGFVFLQLGG